MPPTGSAGQQARQAGDAAEQAASHPAVDTIARVGMAARGVVWVLLGVLALQVAFGSSSESASQKGALRLVADRTGGSILLAIVGLGLVAYAVWRVTEAVALDDAKERVSSAFRAVFGFSLAFSCLSILVGSGGSSQDQQSKSWTAKLMDAPAGRVLVVIAGLVILAVGVYLAAEGVRRKPMEDLKVGQLSRQQERAVEALCAFGYTARGVVIGLIGLFVIGAAITHDPDKSRGLDGALRTVAGQAYGTVLLTLISIGLIAFGLFCWVEARYRRTHAE